MNDGVPEVHFYKWHVSAWLTSDCRDSLDFGGRGIYRELLDHCYVAGTFPDNEDWICRKCACNKKQLRKVWPLIESKFYLKDGRRGNLVADQMRVEYAEFVEQQRSKINQRWKKDEQLGSNLAPTSAQLGSNLESPSKSRNSSLAEKSNEISESSIPPVYQRNSGGNTNTRQYNTREDNTHPQESARVSSSPSAQPKRAREFADAFPEHSNDARTVQQYISVVSPSDEEAVFACLQRYLQSDVVDRGYPQAGWKWLQEQSGNGWTGQWAARKKTADEEFNEMWAQIEERGKVQ